MRLIIKTTILYLLLAVPVFGIGGIITYHMVKKEVEKETDYYLDETFQRLTKAIEEGKPVDALTNEKVVIWPLTGHDWEENKQFTDTIGKHPFLDRPEPYRKLIAISKIQDQYYYISLIDVLIESDDMYEGVVNIVSRLFLFLCLTMLLFSFLISSWLFQPFQQTLESIKNFTLKSKEPPRLPSTSTREFKMLNKFIQRMIVKARKDYRTLKEFTENASHEMQTPISIAKGRLELLMESEDFSEKQITLLQSAHDSITRLSRIGQSLGLLAKIENQEFASNKSSNLSQVTAQLLTHFEELASLRGIQMERHIQKDVIADIDPVLADILVTNLLKNAIQHNEPNGSVVITLTDSKLTIENGGPPPSVSPELLFERFRKGNQSGGSLGLGLAIVKKICEACEWNVDYLFENGIHKLIVDFKNEGN